jgi:hypothetical protein
MSIHYLDSPGLIYSFVSYIDLYLGKFSKGILFGNWILDPSDTLLNDLGLMINSTIYVASCIYIFHRGSGHKHMYHHDASKIKIFNL